MLFRIIKGRCNAESLARSIRFAMLRQFRLREAEEYAAELRKSEKKDGAIFAILLAIALVGLLTKITLPGLWRYIGFVVAFGMMAAAILGLLYWAW